jgi:RNA polymerase-binding transcription factor DksA
MNKSEQQQVIRRLVTRLKSEPVVVRARINDPFGGCDTHTSDLLDARDQARLKDIEHALARMDDKRYGMCEMAY